MSPRTRLPNGFPVEQIVAELRQVPGLVAIVLGGSWASGRQRPDSDIDLALYRRASRPLDTAAVRAVANQLNDTPGPVVTEIGGWGQWVNGGAWLTIGGQRVDFLYGDLDFYASTIEECREGRGRPDYWQRPPYGFFSQIFCAEIQHCRPLYDPEAVIAPLKDKIRRYPEPLKRRTISGFLWGAGFTLEAGHKSAERGEAYLTAGCLTRAITELIQVLYALNETYFMNDKYIYLDIPAFQVAPPDFMARAEEIMGGGTTPPELSRRIAAADALRQEVLALASDLYTPRY